MRPSIVSIVEGHGEVRAVPALIRRLAHGQGRYELHVPPPVRCPRSKIIRPPSTVDEREPGRAIELAAMKIPSKEEGAILVILDADESCPKSVGENILHLARRVRGDVRCGVVLAKWEYEAWLIAALESLRGRHGIRPDAAQPHRPEGIRDAKGYLTEQMIAGRKYSETVDQVALTAVFDLVQAETCRSFRKLKTEIDKLLRYVYGLEET